MAPTGQPLIYDDGRRHIYCTGPGRYVISEGGAWLPGVYESQEVALAAFALDDRVLQQLRDEVAGNPDWASRVITAAMLARVR